MIKFFPIRLRTLAIVPLLLAAGPLAMAQDSTPQNWPDKPIRMVVPAPPGGIIDNVARLLSERMLKDLGQPVIVENKPGGSAVIGERAVINAPDDGYTLLVAPSSILTDFPLSVKTPFDPNKTFTYLVEAARMIHVLATNTEFPAKNVQDVFDLARKPDATVSVANLSTGTRSDLLGKLLREESGQKILVIPYKGSAPAMANLLGDQVQLTFEVVSTAAPLIKAGRLRGLAVASATRSKHLPDVPSFAELGMPEFALPDASVGVFVLTSTPKPMADRIRTEMTKIVSDPSFQEKLSVQGLDVPIQLSPEALQQKLDATMAQNRKILSKLHVTDDASN